MTKFTFSVEIAAPPDRVAAFFVPQRMVYWYGADMNAEFEVQGGASDFAVGQKVRISGRLVGKEVRLTVVVMRYEPGRVLEWEFRDSYSMRGLQSWEISAIDGRTRVRMRDEYEMLDSGTLDRFFDWLLTQRTVAARDRIYLTKLKQLAELS